MRQVIVCVAMTLLLTGCVARRRREQYFMVVEKAEGAGAIMRATATLEGWGGVKYKLNEGYVPMNVIDALSGKVGEPPDLFSTTSLSQRQAELNDKLEEQRGETLKELLPKSKDLDDPKAVDSALLKIDNAIRVFGALKSAAAMSNNEQISIGQTGSTDVYAYRKLVFYASAEVIKLQEFEQELNELEKSTSDLAKAFVQAKQAKAEAAKAKAEQRGKLRQALFGQVQSIITKHAADPKSVTAHDFLGLFATAGLGGA